MQDQNSNEQASDAAAAEIPEGDNAPPARTRLARRGELAQILDAKSAEDVDPKDAQRAPDAWLERRLRVFERQMSTIEARQEQVEKTTRAAVAVVEDAVKALDATVAKLAERLDTGEAKAKAAGNELRAALNEAVLRLQTIEGVAQVALGKPEQSEASASEAQPEEPAAESEPPSDSSEEAPSADEPKPASQHAYLNDVRKSAAAAAAAAEAVQKESRLTMRRFGLARFVLSGLVVLTIFATGAGVAFSKGVSDGRREAMSHGSIRLAAIAAHGATPLDRLSARAEAGDPAAELAIGLRYLDGARRDPTAGYRWIKLAAVHGQAVAQYRLALLLQSGVGTAADPATALQWFEAAALQGNRKAMHDLAVAYAQGNGTAKNPAEAVRWFSRAASFGYVDSEFNLAVLYERGEGVPQSLLDAYKWYSVAGKQGDAESKDRMEALRTQLNGDDLAAARHAANAFHASPFVVSANVLAL